MREPFPYESNAILLSQFLVPEPIPRPIWNRAIATWKRTGGDRSLLKMLIEEGILEEATYLKWMGQVMGCDVAIWSGTGSARHRSPECAVLEQHGFLILDDCKRDKTVAGGPDLPPQLGKYLGPRSREWKWVLLSPRSGMKSQEARASRRNFPEKPATSSTRRWLEELLLNCRARGAADLHLETAGGLLCIRMRTSGGMHEVGQWSGEHAERLIRLLKVWSGLPTTEAALPADGRLTRTIGGVTHTFRVSLLTTTSGESMVLRQLGDESEIRSLSELHVPGRLQQAMIDGVRADTGMFLFTGPTGSGKTTTLYGLLSSLREPSMKIMTIEDPVEYELAHVTQSSVDEAADWTFASAVRAYMRQDPDVIVAGEIRDRDSAGAACRAALTGHSVLTTLHARDTETALGRLRGWGIPNGILQETVRLVVNQRLEGTGPDSPRRARFSWTRPFETA